MRPAARTTALPGAARHAPGPRAVQISLCALALLLPGACAQSSESLPTLLPDASRVTSRGDANDIDAAVEVAVGRVEMSVVRTIRTSQDPHVLRIYELRAANDEPAVLKVRRAGITIENQPVTLELAASFGRFGNPERERALLDAVTRRLGQLAGVQVAPVR